MGCIERKVPDHIDVCQGCGEKAQAAGRGGGSRDHGSKNSGLRAEFGDGKLL